MNTLKQEITISEFVEMLDFAFQPIVNSKTNMVVGYEALLRNYENLGFDTVFQLFDYVYSRGFLYELDIELRKKAIHKYLDGFRKGLSLFYNLDTRILEDKNYKRGLTKEYLEYFGIDPSMFVFEISERFKIGSERIVDIIDNYKRQGFRVAIDDFGVGNVCFESFYLIKPDIVKLDGFFIDNPSDDKKRVFIQILVKLANSLGFSIVAEKVEKEEQIYILDSVGINNIQGFFVSRPTITDKFEKTIDLNLGFQLKRGKNRYREDLLNLSVKVNPVFLHESVSKLFDIITNQDFQYIPVVNSVGIPLFVVNTTKIYKAMVSSRYFLDIYKKAEKKVKDLENYLEKPAVLEINESINLENLTNVMISNRDIVVLTENYRYVGILSYKDLLTVIHKNKIYEAINANPLTGLAGNVSIKEFIDSNISKPVNFAIVYFDFDNFKPFNDKYGFRVGDRVIQLFSSIISANLLNKGYFIGHIGGDDFFAGKQSDNFEEVILDIEHVVQLFKRQVISFYDKEDIKNGYIVSKDRDGNLKKFGFLSVSAAILFIKTDKKSNIHFIDKIISDLKKSAKSSDSHISMAVLL